MKNIFSSCFVDSDGFFLDPCNGSSGFPGGSVVKNPPSNAGDKRDVNSIPRGQKDLLEKKMATHSSIPE